MTLLKRSNARCNSKDYKNALIDFNELRDKDPKEVYLVQSIAYYKFITNDYEAAIKGYQLLLEIDPDNAAINNENIGQAYMNLKNNSGARVSLGKR